MAYKVWNKQSGYIFGIFTDYNEAHRCYEKNWTNVVSLQPTITDC